MWLMKINRYGAKCEICPELLVCGFMYHLGLDWPLLIYHAHSAVMKWSLVGLRSHIVCFLLKFYPKLREGCHIKQVSLTIFGLIMQGLLHKVCIISSIFKLYHIITVNISIIFYLSVYFRSQLLDGRPRYSIWTGCVGRTL